jgi:hypothetical protein
LRKAQDKRHGQQKQKFKELAKGWETKQGTRRKICKENTIEAIEAQNQIQSLLSIFT